MTDFKKLAKSSRISDKIKAAQDISCPAVIIDKIVLASDISRDSEYGKMLMDAISRNPNCSSEHLRYIFENTTEVLQLNVLYAI